MDEIPVRSIGPNRFVRRGAWIAAASLVILLSGGAIWYAQRSGEEKVVKTSAHQAVVPELSQTMYNPAGGGQKEVVLADGSKVWLNSASTLKYPAVFTGQERVVELSGEAYFDVARSADKPFRVLIKDAEVEVLGTHFNIMAYEDEPVIRTTLLDGAVRMESGVQKVDLKPGQQVELKYPSAGEEATMKLVNGIDAESAVAWRNGNIDLTDADLHTVMRALKRYYNIEIQYAQDVPETKPITAGLILQDGLQHNLKLLEGFYGLHFKTDGKIVTVTH
jgi:ferric-dicitrate binding protein FerR (iron transport regulator)